MKIVNDRQEFLNLLDLKDKYCVEIGVFRGDFSKMILKKDPIYLYLIDPFEHNSETYGEGQITTAYSDQEDFSLVKKRFKDDHRVTVLKYYSHDIVRTFKNNYLDFIYHDASHLYKDLKRDLKEWLPKLKEGGIMAGHDYTENYKDYVCKAVDEFCKEHSFEMFLYNENGGDYALKRK